jgi:hypothetical protein
MSDAILAGRTNLVTVAGAIPIDDRFTAKAQ